MASATLELKVKSGVPFVRKAARSERFQPAHFEEVLGPVIEVNELAEITDWNAEAESIFGWSAAEALGRKVEDFLLAPIDRARFELWKNSGPRLGLEEFRAFHKSGRQFQTLFKRLEGRRFLIRAICKGMSSEEASIIASEESFKVLLETLPVGVWIANREGQIVLGNPAAQKFWEGAKFVGIPRYGEYKGWWLDTGKRIEPDEWALSRAIRNGETALNELVRIETFDGTSKTMLNSAAPIRNAKQEIIGAVVVNQDVSELTRAKAEALYNEKEFLTAVLDNTEDGIVACDSNGILTFFNRASREFHGLLEKPIPPEKWAKHYDLFRADGKTPLSKEEIPLFRALQGEKIHGFEMVIAPKGSPSRRVLASGQALYDSQGRKLGAIASMHDVTKRKIVEEELRRQKSLLQYVIDFVPHSIFWKDREDRFLGGNKSFLTKALGVKTVEEIVGKTDLDFFPKEQAEYFRKIDKAVLESGQPMLDVEEPQYQVGAGMRVLVTSKVPLLDEKRQVVGLLGSFMDITERKRMEQELEEAKKAAEAAALVKSEFLATVSHELRTPLTLVMGPLEMILSRRDRDLSKEVREELERILRNASKLFVLVNDILDFTKLEAGKAQLNWERVDVGALVSEVVVDAALTAKSRNIRLSFTPDPALAQVPLDRGKFEKIVLNLLGNALKFTQIGGRVEVKLQSEEKDFVLSVTDTGPGIAPEQQKLLFQKFQQLDSSATRKYEGTGLGLALVKQFAELMGGSVGLQSEQGKGSTFSVRLPKTANHVRVVHQGSELVNEHRLISKRARVPSLKAVEPVTLRTEALLPWVLVVEDNPDMRAYLTEILNDEFRVETAENGIQALNKIKAGHTSLIVSDIMMPEMDGLELVSRLKKNRDFQHIPIILVTAKASREEVVTGLNVGADDYLVKPFGPAELKARIRAALRLREIQEQLIQASKMAAMGTLVAGLSHELNNPLAAISMNAELLLRARDIGEPAMRKAAETICIQTERCASLVRALLDYSLQKPARMESIAPSLLLERVVKLASPIAHQKEIRIETDMSASKLEGVILQIYIQEIETALLNLVSNALGATSAGGSIRIKAEARKREERDGLEISVIDTGHGIPKDVLPRIFDPFFTTKPPGAGTGLGLSLTRKTVESHGGIIRVESEEGKGTSIQLWLPAEGKERS